MKAERKLAGGSQSGANSIASTFEDRLRAKSMAPLWTVLHTLVTPVPKSRARAAQWKYADVRALVMEGANVISPEEAERRVLILENPAMPGQSAITNSLYAGVQLVLPGETAPSHRHSQSALRIVIEGDGGFTTVEGDRVSMYAGDVILTPAWTWHEHGNPAASPMIWVDGLDVQLVNALDASFMQHGQNAHRVTTNDDGGAVYGATMGPMDDAHSPHRQTPAPKRYGYKETRAALSATSERGLDPWHGVRLRFLNPVNGDWPMPTLGPFAQLVPAKTRTEPYRSTDGSIFVVFEGTGAVTIEGERFSLTPKDVFVVPAWAARSFEADDDLVLLAYSDRPAQEKLGLWREERLGQKANSQ